MVEAMRQLASSRGEPQEQSLALRPILALDRLQNGAWCGVVGWHRGCGAGGGPLDLALRWSLSWVHN